MVKKNQIEWNDDSSSDSAGEKGNANTATRSCDHVKKSVDSAKLRKLLKTTGLVLKCIQCQKMCVPSVCADASVTPEAIGAFEYDNTLWLCLKCGTQLCGRSKNQHALKHFKTPHSDCHALTINTRSFEIWCYECDNEVKADSRKNLLECAEFVKSLAQKPPVEHLENATKSIFNTLEPLKPLPASDEVTTNNKFVIPLPPPPLPPIPGLAKRINEQLANYSNYNNQPVLFNNSSNLNNKSRVAEQLPRVRGLTNLGNTCFFNAVLQCLAQTPYLLDVLKESAEPGEEFTLPGGTFKSKDEEILNLPPIKGTLSASGGLTAALANSLEELQSGGGVFNPCKLFQKLCAKCPQFQGGDQHDSHELLRHLLESVRSEDLKRYQRVILQNLGYKDQDINTVSEDMKQKCKIYGNQAADRILRPEQVFRGFLVSTLICGDCCGVSSRHEYFLDMSLPVSVKNSQPPQQRRKTSPDNANSFFLHPVPSTSPTGGPTKAQLKKEQKKERKAKKTAKHQHTKLVQKQLLTNAIGDIETSGDGKDIDNAILSGCATREEAVSQNGTNSRSSSSPEQSDADVEDNLLDDNEKCVKRLNTSNSSTKNMTTNDSNGNNQVATSPVEKRGDSPENIDKDSLDEDENDSGIATSTANAGASSSYSSVSNSETNGDTITPDIAGNNSVLSLGISEKGANIVRQLTINDLKGINSNSSSQSPNDTVLSLTNGEVQQNDFEEEIVQNFNELNLNNDAEDKLEYERKAARAKARRVRTQSNSDWKTTFAPHYKCEDSECSVQSCLNNFNAIELMTGNNKVGCESCTKRINGDDPKAKTIYTNSTKQFLISSPPAVLILHLKRFQLEPRCMFRKLTRHVNFPMILDVAPFCGSKVKNLPNIDRKQKKLLYALYGVVEHSGSMCGGHYTAYVKVRSKLNSDDKRWKFIPQGSKSELDQDDEQRKKLDELLAREKARELRMKAANDSDDYSRSSSSSDFSNTSSSSSSEREDMSTTPQSPACDASVGATGGDEEASNAQMPLGIWYYVSDSRVELASEDQVLKAQAYLLFYERIY